MLCVGVLAIILGMTMTTIIGLWYLLTDVVYVILFPQLVCALYVPASNTYGSVSGYVIGGLLRFLAGEPLIGLPALIKYPMYHYDYQGFPFRTLTMLLSLLTIFIVSYATKYLFGSGKLPKSLDIFRCFNARNETIALQEQPEKDFPVAREDKSKTEKSALLDY